MAARKRARKNGKTPPQDEPRLPVPVRKATKDSVPRARRGTVTRRTKETDVSVALEALAKHSLIDLQVRASGDIEVDAHHTVEDVALCIGRALVEAIGDRAGMTRYGEATLPFDETLVRCYVDLCGRPAFVYRVEIAPGRVGTFDAELCEVFFSALANEGRMNLHLVKEYGTNRHHIIEGCFKSLARALERAIFVDPRRERDVASTKGSLD